MAKYRIKTEQEFIKEFGEDWADIVEFTWATNMSYLHNKIIEVEEFPFRVDKWNISKDMVVKIKHPILAIDRSLLEHLANTGNCRDLKCGDCPIYNIPQTKGLLECTSQEKLIKKAKILLEIRNRLEVK